MDSNDSPIVPEERRADSNSAVVADETSLPAVETTGQKFDPEPKSTDRSAKAAKDTGSGTKPKQHRQTKNVSAKKVKPAEESDSNTKRDETEGSTTSDSDSTDSDPDSDQKIRKRGSRALRKRATAKKVRGKHLNHRAKKLKHSNPDSYSKSNALSFDGLPDSCSSKRGKIGAQLKDLHLQISKLQKQLASPRLVYGRQLVHSEQLVQNGQLCVPVVGCASGIKFSNVPALPPPFANSSTRSNSPAPTTVGRGMKGVITRGRSGRAAIPGDHKVTSCDSESKPSKLKGANKKKPKSGGRAEFKRVDWVWDSSLYSYRLQDTTEAKEDAQYSGYVFHVRRTFDCEGKYRRTFVDIKSKLLRECLQDVIGHVKGVSLVDETPKLDPNLLFLYLEEMRAHLEHLKQAKPAGEDKKGRKKNQKRLNDKRSQLKAFIKYLDTDFSKTKESLNPMLASGLITFDLLWALWKPHTLAFSSTYACQEEPRVFKVEVAERHRTIMRGDFYFVEGKYTEFDGKKFGYGSVFEDIPEFQGAKKITSLAFYPLKYHKNEAQIRKDLVERGKKFVTLSGVHYKSYTGMAFLKRKRNQVVKFNIQQSRIMVDPAIFRRINPNYNVSIVRPKDHDVLSSDELSDEELGCDCSSDCSEGGDSQKKQKQFVTKLVKDEEGIMRMIRISEDDLDAQNQKPLNSLPDKVEKQSTEDSKLGDSKSEKEEKEPLPELTDEDHLIASPVVLGFSFSEKQWLEFAVSGVKNIKWNDQAWDSLVLEPKTKDLIQALVKSRKYNAAQTIDDVIQGKGKGLVTVLHGPPGTGKTLTAEGISELLKCPLYMASTGELGTDSRFLETELQKILDVCHAWGAILLLDEADVFLEKRNMQDIQRNALVSIFLRQLEYFQGILFLTTNRVETFDEAFQSRIHIALKYEALDAKAKRTIFNMFIDRVRVLGKLKLKPFTEEDFSVLAKYELNGREIKNVVSSAQDLAVNRNEALSMAHIRQVLEVHVKFGRDLRGGPGYEEAMRSYS